MKFSFREGLRFECTRCGKCCYPEHLSLSREDYRYIHSLPLDKSLKIEESDSSFYPYSIETRGRCPFLKRKRLCSIYPRRPIVCRAFPLTFSILPDEEIFVNLIHCEGVDSEIGGKVDEAYIRRILNEIESVQPDFIDILREDRVQEHRSLQPFTDSDVLTDFDSKRMFRSRICSWLEDRRLRGQSIRLKCHIVFGALMDLLHNVVAEVSWSLRLPKPVILLSTDLELIAEKLEALLDVEIEKRLREDLLFIEKRNSDALKSGYVEVFWDDKIRRVHLDDQLPFRDLFGNISKVAAKNFVFEKPFDDEAEKLAHEYIQEVINRLDVGGLPISAKMSDMLATLDQYSMNLQTYCQFYASHSDHVDVEAVKKAIMDLDTRLLISKIYADILSRYH